MLRNAPPVSQSERERLLAANPRRDHNLASGDGIPIEERAAKEVTHMQGVLVAPEGIQVANPAFDVTPNRYVSAIITERGVARPPYTETLRKLCDSV